MRKYIPLVLFIFSWPVLCADIHGRVVRVLDGDTIEVMDSRKAVRIRLINIDAPEKKQDYGRWSTDMMKSLVAGKTVTVTYFQRDRYGRILGQVYAPDGMNVNQFMVRAGAAWVYEQYNTDPVLPVLQNEARQQKRGLWSDADRFPPGYGDTVNKAMAILSFICLSGNKNGENKTGMAVSVTAMFISQYAGKNYS